MILDTQMILSGLHLLFSPENFFFICLGLFVGIIAGALPGVSAATGLVVLLPLTYTLESSVAINMLMAVYCGAMFGGSIPAILIKTPGTPGAAATTFDGYPMTQKGQSFKALITAVVASVFGGYFSAVVLFFFGPFLSYYAVKFGPAEIVLISIFGLTVLGSVGAEDVVKGLMAGAFGLLLGTIGMEYNIGFERFSFNLYTLYDGIPLITALVGLLAFSETINLVQRESILKDTKFLEELQKADMAAIRSEVRDVLRHPVDLFRASIIGTIIGSIPGEGAAVANFVSYDQARRYSKQPKLFGTGIVQGIIATEASNNAVTGGACIPTFTLGIPGSSSTAILLGVLMIHGLQPGPGLFHRSGNLMYAILISLFITNGLLLFSGIFCARYFAKVIQIPTRLLVPVISILMGVGCYLLRNNVNDILLMLIFGLLGYYMHRRGYPPVATVVGLILSPIAEKNAIAALAISQGSLAIFFQSAIAIGLWGLIVLSIVIPLLMKKGQAAEH